MSEAIEEWLEGKPVTADKSGEAMACNPSALQLAGDGIFKLSELS